MLCAGLVAAGRKPSELCKFVTHGIDFYLALFQFVSQPTDFFCVGPICLYLLGALEARNRLSMCPLEGLEFGCEL